MKIIKAEFDTGYVDGDGCRTQFYLFDDVVSDNYINDIVRCDANDYFEDHEYLAQGYSYEYGFEDEEDADSYYEGCSYAWELSTEEERQEWIINNGFDDTIDLRQ